MAEVASAFVTLMPSTRGFGSTAQRQLGPQMNSVAKTTGSRFGKVFAYASASPLKAIGAAALGLFAVQKVKDFFQGAIAEARESQKVSALTAQVIKSTGGAAGISAKQVGDLAGSISRLTGIDDEAIQGAENLLLTFTNLRNEAGKGNDVFNQATKIVTDMSTALDQDLKSSSIQVGKALNDPIKGITALSRVGVAFTEQQKKQITTLVDSGQRLKAQKIILGELKKEFGGAAAAAATSGDKFKTAFANLQESVGLALLPVLDRFLDKGTQVINFLIDKVPPAWAAFRAAVMPVVSVLQEFVGEHLEAFKTALAALGGSALTSVISLIGGSLVSAIGVLVGALASPVALIGALVGAAIYAYVHFEGFRTSVNNLATALRDQLGPVITQAGAFITGTLVPALISLGGYIQTNVVPALQQFGQYLVANVLPIVGQVAGFLVGTFYPAMFKVWATVAQKLAPVFAQLVATLRADVIPTITLAVAKFREWWPTIQQVIQVVAKLYGKWIEFQATIAGKVLPVVIRFIGFLISNAVPAILRNVEVVAKIISKLIEFGGVVVDRVQDVARFVQGLKEKFGDALNYVKGIPQKIKSALGAVASLLYSAGRDLIQGLINGIKSMASSAAQAAKDAVQGAINGAKDLLKIGSPSKLFHQFGKWTIEGLANGILAESPTAVAAALEAATKVQAAVLDRLTSMRDGVKGVLDGLKSDFASLRDSVASAFTGDLFSSTTADGFVNNLVSTRGNIGAIIKAFHKLEGWGLKSGFLAQLLQSGNGALILDLAAGTRGEARTAGNEFGAVTALSQQLGSAVARDSIGPKLDQTNHRLERIEHAIKGLGRDFGREVNKAHTAGHRGRAA